MLMQAATLARGTTFTRVDLSAVTRIGTTVITTTAAAARAQ